MAEGVTAQAGDLSSAEAKPFFFFRFRLADPPI